MAGPLFFGSARDFINLFTPREDPEEVVIDLAHTTVEDMSGVEALNAVWKRYEEVDDSGPELEGHLYRRPKRVYLQNPTPTCARFLRRSTLNEHIKVIQPHRNTRHFHPRHGHGRPRSVSVTDRELASVNQALLAVVREGDESATAPGSTDSSVSSKSGGGADAQADSRV